HQGLGRGLLSSKPVRTFDEAKRVYYEARSEGYRVNGIEIDGTVLVSDEENWNSADDNKADSKSDVEGNSSQTDKDSSGDNGTAVKRGAAESASESSDSAASDSGKQDQGKAAGPIQIVRGSELTGNLVQVSSKGSLTLKDIVIDGNQENAKTTTKSLIQVSDGGTLNIENGAVLKNNRLTDLEYFRACGGAVKVNDGTLNMKGGTIEDNTAVLGGGVYVNGRKAVFNMSGGLIKNNTAVNGSGSSYSNKEERLAAGGGVDIFDGVVMNLSGGTIENNRSEEIGGGISVGTGVGSNDPETLIMTGGNIDSNSAGSGGGGIFVQAGTRGAAGKAVVSGGTIFKNKMTGEGIGNNAFGGGGIYVNGYSSNYPDFESGQLILTNALIYDNSAAIAGGGYAACPVSHTHIYVKNGAAFYSNQAEKAKEIYILASTAFGIHSGNPTYIISESMFGGNPYHWKYDNNTEVPLNRLSGQLRAIYSESLNLHTDETPGENARNQARVQIYGNTSVTRGGGIGSNGTVTIGKEDTTKVTARKTWDDGSQSARRPDSIDVQLFRSTKSDLSDKQYIGYITLTPDKDGNWTNTAEFKNLAEKDADGNTYIYTVGEKKISGYDATVTQDEKTKDFTITNKPSQTPPTPTPTPVSHHVTVQKVWKLDDGGTRPDSVQVQLMKNGTAYSQPVTLNDANNWTYTWDGLADDNSSWTVQEVVVPNGFTETQQTAAETNGSRVTITNDDNPTKPNTPDNPNSDKPNKPDTPKTNKTVNPKTPSGSNNTVTPNTPSVQHTTVQNTPSTPSSAPQTSDQTRLGTELILFGGAAALLALVLAVKRRKTE
ncbi:MAG: Cna B-type domain-containing protein, partial [Eubacterium sp.]